MERMNAEASGGNSAYTSWKASRRAMAEYEEKVGNTIPFIGSMDQ